MHFGLGRKGFYMCSQLGRRPYMTPQFILTTFLFSAFFIASSSATPSTHASRTKQSVRLSSPCKITGQHGIDRWSAKTDPEKVPADKSKVTSISPSQMFAWPGVGVGGGLTKKIIHTSLRTHVDIFR